MSEEYLELDVQMPRAFHQSDLNGFNSCPAKWALSKVNTYRSASDTTHLRLGSLVHDTIDKYYKMLDEVPNPNRAKILIQNLFEEKWRTGGIYELKAKYEKCLANYINFEIFRLETWKSYLPTKTEYRFKYKNGEFNYSGIIDFYSEVDGTMVDWKTSSDTQLTATHLRQAEIFRRAIPGMQTVIFVCLGSGSILTAPPMPDGWILEETRKFRDTVLTGKYLKKRNPWCTNCEEMWSCEFSDVKLWDDQIW